MIFKLFSLSLVTGLSACVAVQGLSIISDVQPDTLTSFLFTAVLFLILYFLFLKHRLEFWHTFFHELTHLLFAILTFNKIRHFQASMKSGGEITYEGSGNWLISLSPYFFPIHTVLIMVFGSWMIPETEAFVRQLVVVSYTFFGITLFKQFTFTQSDIYRTGKLFSLLMVIQLNLLFLLFIIFYLQGSNMLFLNRILGVIADLLRDLCAMV